MNTAGMRMLGGLLLFALPGCAGNSVTTMSSDACRPPEANELSTDYAVAEMAGTHALWMFADQGTFEGAAAMGELRMSPYDEAPASLMGGASAMLHGTADLDLAKLGAANTGDTMSDDVQRPGVLVLQPRGGDAATDARDVTIRLGAISNRMDRIVFDGSYTVLRPTSATDTLISGRWESGAGAGVVAGGRFCAIRR